MRRYLSVGLLLLVLSVNAYVRMMPVFLPDAERLARGFVLSEESAKAANAVNEKFKNIPGELRGKIIDALENSRSPAARKDIAKRIRIKTKEARLEYQDERGHTYLLEYDPYHWYRLVNNLVKTGRVWDKEELGRKLDSFMLAPIGMEAKPTVHQNLHVYLAFFAFKVVSFFLGDLSVMHFVFYIPLIVTIIALIVLYLFCGTLSKDSLNITGLVAVAVMGFSPIFANRSLAGWFDTDAYIILFSLFIIWLFYLALRQGQSFRKRSVFCLLAAVNMGLFSFTWDAWWYIFDILVIVSVLLALDIWLARKFSPQEEGVAPVAAIAGLFIVLSFIFVAIFSGYEMVWRFFADQLKVFYTGGGLDTDFWPRAYLTVQELQGKQPLEIMRLAGANFFFFPALAFALYQALIIGRVPRERQFVTILFFVWGVVFFFLSVKAIRFTMFLSLPVAVFCGLLADWLVRVLFKKVSLSAAQAMIGRVALVIFYIFLVFFTAEGLRYRQTRLIIIKKDMRDVLTGIKAGTPKDAIINTWWDYGHWIKALADRRVIFDGSTQNTPLSYWIARVFVTRDEIEAAGILRMLNSGSNKAFEELEKLGFDKLKCMGMLKRMIRMNKDRAGQFLLNSGVGVNDADRILGLTHNPRPAYFLVTPQFLSFTSALSFLGGWDFAKAEIYKKFREVKPAEFIRYLKTVHNFSDDDAARLQGVLSLLDKRAALDWISPRAPFNKESFNFVKVKDKLFFDSGFTVDLKDYSVSFYNPANGGWYIPRSIIYIEDSALKELPLENSNIDISVLLLKRNDNYKLVAFDSRFSGSMLVRLCYLDGAGLEYFKPVMGKDAIGPGGGKIVVYKLDWEKMKQGY